MARYMIYRELALVEHTRFYRRIRGAKSGRDIFGSMCQIYRTKGHGYQDIKMEKI